MDMPGQSTTPSICWRWKPSAPAGAEATYLASGAHRRPQTDCIRSIKQRGTVTDGSVVDVARSLVTTTTTPHRKKNRVSAARQPARSATDRSGSARINYLIVRSQIRPPKSISRRVNATLCTSADVCRCGNRVCRQSVRSIRFMSAEFIDADRTTKWNWIKQFWNCFVSVSVCCADGL